MYPEHDRKLAAGFRRGGRIDVEIQAVFAGSGVLEDHVVKDASLSAMRAVVCRVAGGLPLHGRCRRLPSQISDGWRGVGQSKKRIYFSIVDGLALYLAFGCFHRQ